MENLYEKKIKILRSDNGGELSSNEFLWIKRELTTPYNPQHNGVEERKNRSIMEAVKAMIHDQDIPMHLWVGLVRTVVYVNNRISHNTLEKKPRRDVHW